MRLPGARFLAEWRELKRFNALPASARRLVFYAEDHASWVHLGPIVEHLTGELGQELCYLTSSPADPVLTTADPRIRPFSIGTGTVRTLLFSNLDCGLMVMTMPDLETMYIKRSRSHPVHYVYVFHSIVSTHMIYRPAAFDHFDTIFTVGPHHDAEIRATEAVGGLPAKRLFEHGYGRLDAIVAANAGRPPLPPLDGRKVKVLVAPSWGADGLIETRGAELAEALLGAGCEVCFRPHPVTRSRWPKAIAALDRFAGDAGFRLETDIASQQSLLEADLMISDWSGAALEFAFGLERPVLFVDVPRKVNNPDWRAIGLEPLEAAIRERLGAVLAADNLAAVGDEVRRLCADPAACADRIRTLRAETVYNLGSSGRVGAEELVRMLAETGAKEASDG